MQTPNQELTSHDLIHQKMASIIPLKGLAGKKNQKMKFYKLLHKPTKLFFTPSKGSGNLSKTGKIYHTMPSLKWVETLRIKIYSWSEQPKGHHKTIVEYFNLDWDRGVIDKYVKTRIDDWEIVELNSSGQ